MHRAQYAPAPADRRPTCSFFRLRNIEGSQNFEIGSRTPGHAHLRANLWSGGKNCPRPMCVPNLKGVALSVCEILAHFAAVH